MSATTPVPPPIAEHRPHDVFFGRVEGEDRGPNPMDPPRVRTDNLFWLRDDARSDPAVLAHLQLEKAYYEDRVADIQPLIKDIYDEHVSHIQETDVSAPYKHGPFWYFTREKEGLSYKIYCRAPISQNEKLPNDGELPESLIGEVTLMDVNAVAAGKPFCDVHTLEASPSHSLVVYSVDWSGNEVYTIEFLNKAKEDVIEGTNGDVVWGRDDSCFFYITKDATLRDNAVWRHIVGQPQSSDVKLYQDDDNLFSVFVGKSGDGETLFIGSVSSETTEIHLLDLRKGNEANALEVVRKREKGVRYNVEMHGVDTLIVLTNEGGAVNNKIVLARRQTPSLWDNVLVPHSTEDFIESHTVLEGFMVIEGRSGGLTRIWTVPTSATTAGSDGGKVFTTPEECPMMEVQMEEPVFTVEVVQSHMKDYHSSFFRMLYSSMATPHIYYDVHGLSHRHQVVKKKIVAGFDPSDYVVERLCATAPDKTSIPLSIVHHKDVDISGGGAGPHPCLLYGYGSYGLSMDPSFSIKPLPYMERGMVYVVAHIRGGSEMGRAWYEVGAKYLTKRNTFSDFIAAAEFLVEKGITTPKMLACEGRSAGGLLIGAVLNMRPDLFHVALAGVPFVDVMTTMCDPSIPLTTGEWEEWGNPNEYRYFDYMLSYSPMDNVRAQEYPNIMVQAGLHDPRVAYWEPAKWVSKLRETKTDHNEVVLNMDLESGHFSAKDRYKYWKEMAIQQAFVCKHLKCVARTLLRK